MRVSRLAVGTVVFILSSALWLALRLADADVPPAGYGQPSGEFDITLSRVPVSERAVAKALPEGKGDGGAAKILPIQPRDFTNPKFDKVRTPGEMMWVLKNGSLGQTGQIPGTGMLPVVDRFIDEEEAWKAILYERSLGEAK
ncbi:MAG: hypothetical protein E6K59_02500 [Nitrospirae bacterium]|nr:MAG: hypothetical protein E6K59_02500 [Nitrospirota bacterium]